MLAFVLKTFCDTHRDVNLAHDAEVLRRFLTDPARYKLTLQAWQRRLFRSFSVRPQVSHETALFQKMFNIFTLSIEISLLLSFINRRKAFV